MNRPDKIFSTFTEAVKAWNKQPKGTVGVVILIMSLAVLESTMAIRRVMSSMVQAVSTIIVKTAP